MAHFFGILPGEERKAPAIRVSVPAAGETVWMHGKWLDLGPDHGVIWIDRGATAHFIRPDGKALRMGLFPAWVVYGSGKNAAHAGMFNVGQFRGGQIIIRAKRSRDVIYDVPAAAGLDSRSTYRLTGALVSDT